LRESIGVRVKLVRLEDDLVVSEGEGLLWEMVENERPTSDGTDEYYYYFRSPIHGTGGRYKPMRRIDLDVGARYELHVSLELIEGSFASEGQREEIALVPVMESGGSK
jgi:hypothetical protein